MESLGDIIRDYINLSNQIKDSKAELRFVMENKIRCEQSIIEHMKEQNLPSITIENVGKITRYESKSTKAINKDYLTDTLLKQIDDAGLVNRLAEATFGNRPSVKVEKIKLIQK